MPTSIFLIKIADFYTQAKKWLFEVFVPEENNQYLPEALKPKLLFCYSAILLLIKIAAISFFLFLPYSNFFSAITQDRLIVLINQARQNNNLPAVSLNEKLNTTANLKINDMLTNNYFEHISPAGVTPWSWFKKAGYNYAYAGENLAIDFAQTDDVFSAWMASPTHRDNILNPNFNEIGLAVKNGPLQNHDATLAVLVFGRPAAEIARLSGGKPQTGQSTTSADTISKEKTISASGRSATPTPKIQKTPLPRLTTTPIQSPSTIPLISNLPSTPANQIIAEKENIELKSIAGETTENLGINAEPAKIPRSLSSTSSKWTPRVLGVFASKTDEVTKSLYLYFALFLALALMVNIFVKIEIQYWPTIFSTTLVILLSSALIFI